MRGHRPADLQSASRMLEARCRVLTAVALAQAVSFAALCSFVSSGAVAGAQVADSPVPAPRDLEASTLRVRRLELLGENGRTAVIIDVSADESEGRALTLREPRSTPRLRLWLGREGAAGITAGDVSSSPSGSDCFLGVASSGFPLLGLSADDGPPEIQLDVSAGSPQLAFLDADGKPLIGAAIFNGSPSIRLGDQPAPGIFARIEAGAGRRFGVIVDTEGKARMGVFVDNSLGFDAVGLAGVARVTLYDARATPGVDMAALPRGLPAFSVRKK